VAFDAVLLVSFGGPEGPEDVMPFLENVLRGRPVGRDRMEQVAAHYLEFGGVSPINEQNRKLAAALGDALAQRGWDLPVYWGNRNWHPYLAETVQRMQADGIRRAAAFATSAYSSYSSCRQYLGDLAQARATVGAGAPELVKLRPYFNHPGFVAPLADGLRTARAQAGPDAPVLMTAHSLPCPMAATCEYEQQLGEAARLVATLAGETSDGWRIVFQSRSGPPQQPWLEPEINDVIAALPHYPTAIVVPIGFVSDHMEVVYDLDRVAAATAARRGISLLRSATPGTDPRFVDMILDLIAEAEGRRAPSFLGDMGPAAFPCAAGCCPPAAAPRPEPGSVGTKRGS
jgi:ferrochelatase